MWRLPEMARRAWASSTESSGVRYTTSRVGVMIDPTSTSQLTGAGGEGALAGAGGCARAVCFLLCLRVVAVVAAVFGVLVV